MADDLKWNSYDNNRNKVHSKCHVLESSPDHPPPPPTLVRGKIVFHKIGLWCQKRLGIVALKDLDVDF